MKLRTRKLINATGNAPFVASKVHKYCSGFLKLFSELASFARGTMEVVVLRYRATFILLLVYTLFARPSFSSAFDLANYSRAPQSPFNSRLQTTERAPEACNCAQVRSRKVGVCHFYTDEASGSCGSRPCRKSYQCTSMITGLTCMRRRTVKKIVPLPQSPYSCKTVRTNGIMYVLEIGVHLCLAADLQRGNFEKLKRSARGSLW